MTGEDYGTSRGRLHSTLQEHPAEASGDARRPSHAGAHISRARGRRGLSRRDSLRRTPDALMVSRLAFSLLALLLMAAPALSQTAPPRIGVGIDALVIPVRAGDVDPGVGLGIRGRVALPVNSDLSAAASLGISTSLAGSAVLTATPQVSMIVTLPGGANSVRYLIGGFGGYVPFSGGGAGPTVHVGFGWAIPLSETSLYLEIDPALVVGSDALTFLIPVRAGVIF